MIPFDVVVAADLDSGIGKNGQLPWRIAEDMAHFKRVTTTTRDPDKQNAVLMGRKTWESIPARFRPLPQRVNVLLSRQPHYARPDGVLLFAGLDQALAQVEACTDVEGIFVVGGAEIYRAAVAHDACRRIYLTRVHTRCACDVFFPELRARFARVSHETHCTTKSLRFDFEVLDRV